MEEYNIEYIIENRYEKPVRSAYYQLLVIPCINDWQHVKEVKYFCSGNKEMHTSKNIFGFNTLSYNVREAFNEFHFRLEAKVIKPLMNPFYVSPLLPYSEFEMLYSINFQIDNHRYLSQTKLTQLPAILSCTFPCYSNEIQVFDYLLQLNNYIYNLLEYSPESTNINTTVEEVLKIRKGVCQDYAHLFISICRLNKIPARYVSGYLNQGVGFKGTSQLHAWVEAYVPDLGWVGLDATNNLLADHHYIKIAHGTDYCDCSPIIGVLDSSGLQRSIHSVTILNQ